MKKVEEAIEYFEGLLERLGNGDCDNMVCATALDALYEKRERDTLLSEVSGGVEMLSRKQLEDAANCEVLKCKTCSMDSVCYETVFSGTNALAQTALLLMGELEQYKAVLKQARTALKSTVDDAVFNSYSPCESVFYAVNEAIKAIDELEGSE